MTAARWLPIFGHELCVNFFTFQRISVFVKTNKSVIVTGNGIWRSRQSGIIVDSATCRVLALANGCNESTTY